MNRKLLVIGLLFVSSLNIHLLSNKLKLSKRKASEVQFKLGVIALKHKLYKEALMRFKKAYKLGRRDYKILNNIAVSYEALGEFKKAEFYYKKAIELSGENFNVRENYERFKSFSKRKPKKHAKRKR